MQTLDVGEKKAFRIMSVVRPRFSDIDLQGIVNNAVYLSYMEDARIGYAKVILKGVDDPRMFHNVTAMTRIEYLKPLGLNDRVELRIRTSRLGNRSFTFLFRFDRGDELCAVAESVQTMIDPQTGEAALLPSDWRQTVRNFEIISPDDAAHA